MPENRPPASRTRRRGWLHAALITAAAALVVFPLVYWDGGVLDEETISFLRHYLDARPLLQQVFDSHANDFGTYQARELSYLVDALDARFFRALLVRGHVLFFNLSGLLAALLTVGLVARGVRAAFPRVSPAVGLLALLVYLSTPVLSSTLGTFYRATMPLVAPLILAGLFTLRLAVLQSGSRRGRLFWPLVLFAIALLATLLDRQGFYDTAAGAVCLGLVSLRRRDFVPATVALILAAASGLVYNHWLGPWLIHATNGYWPSFAYQQFSIDEVLRPGAVGRGVHLALVFLGSFLASFSPLAVAGVIALGLALLWPRPAAAPSAPGESAPGRRSSGSGLEALALLAFVAGQFLLVFLMVVRQPYMYDIRDGWRWYHPLPLHAMLLFVLLWLLDRRGLVPGSARERGALAGLVLVVVANLGEWPVNRAQMERGPWFGKIARQSASLHASFREGEPEPSLEGLYRRFYFHCLDSSPAILSRGKPQAGEGRGFFPAEMQGGRLVAYARRSSVVRLFVPSAGRLVFRGELWLAQPGGAVRVFLPSGEVQTASCGAGCQGPIAVVAPLDLPPGVSEVRLESEQGDVEGVAAGGRRRLAFKALLPFGLERE